MSLSMQQPPGIFEDGGNHMKPFLTALAIFAASAGIAALISLLV